MLSRALMFDRFLASDASYDGRFITGVLTTGIYCRPSCTARKPRPENVRFFRSGEDARHAGLRACRRCHPDDATVSDDREIASGVAARLREDPARFRDVRSLARAAGVGLTTLHEIVRRHFHLTPAELLRRERIAAACTMLRDSRATVTAIAERSGFGSQTNLNENFRRYTGMSPREYRNAGSEFTIALPPGYAPGATLRYASRDAESRTERGNASGFAKALHLDGQPAIVHVRFDGRAAHCRIEGPATPASFVDAHRAILRLLGLPFDPAPFERRLLGERHLAPLVSSRRGLRVPQTASVFEAIVWSIVGQQVNLAFAYKLRRVVIELAGTEFGGMLVHPDAAAVARVDYDDLTSRQFSRRKAEYLIDTARLVASGALDAEAWPQQSAVDVEAQLMSVRGFGAWSTNYVLMRGCGFADCVPVGDSGLTASLRDFFALEHRPDADETAALMQQFAPNRSVATFHFWMRLNESAM